MIRSLQKKKKFPGVDIDKVHKERICKCGNTYVKFTSLQNKCVKCLAAKGKQLVAKATRKVYREQKEKLKTRSDYLKEAQVEFNRFIRLRDSGKVCISCKRRNNVKVNAGHYRSVGAFPELRYCEDNCHLQCEHCNTFLSGNLVEYRKALIQRIGIERAEWLEGPHEPKKYTIEELKALRDKYRVMGKAIKWNKVAA